MISSTPSAITRLLRGATTAVLLSLLAGFCAVAGAATLCEKGVIRVLEHAGGGDSTLHIRTEESSADNGSHSSSGYVWLGHKLTVAPGYRATRMWYDNPTRWRDRISFLRTAYALQLPVKISSADHNCMGPSDEFSISLCRVGEPSC
jgi:hypothetical protein